MCYFSFSLTLSRYFPIILGTQPTWKSWNKVNIFLLSTMKIFCAFKWLQTTLLPNVKMKTNHSIRMMKIKKKTECFFGICVGIEVGTRISWSNWNYWKKKSFNVIIQWELSWSWRITRPFLKTFVLCVCVFENKMQRKLNKNNSVFVSVGKDVHRQSGSVCAQVIFCKC